MRKLLVYFTLLITNAAFADDIELYLKRNVNAPQTPKVMIIFDTSGSMAFSSITGDSCGYDYGRDRYILCPDNRLGVAKNAIAKLINDNADIDFGLMRFNGSNGGYILAGLGANRSTILNQVSSLEANGATPLSETLWESYLYLSGRTRYYSWFWPSADQDTSVERYGHYISPFEAIANDPNVCGSSANVIIMTDGEPSNDSDSDLSIISEYLATFSILPTTLHSSYLPALAEVIHQRDDLYTLRGGSVKDRGRVYTIGFGRGMDAGGIEILEKTAELGGGVYTQANTASELSEALKNQLDNIRELNDSFTSPSIATSSSDQTQSGKALYYTMFLASPNARWQGNLKKLEFSNNNVVDMHGAAALDENGLIKAGATTFWSESGSQDGNSVKRGGVNERLQKQSQRTIYSDYGSGTLREFSAAEGKRQYRRWKAFADKLKIGNISGRKKTNVEQLINWVYGQDVDDEDKDGNTSERRESIFGDPLHSKPVTMDYGNGDIRVIVGTNAGLLHMFKDEGKTVSESWAFIPEDLFDILHSTRVSKADTKLYGMDGPLTVYFHDINQDQKVNGEDKVWLFAGMRRGGNRYYAFDITTPDSPTLLWGGPIVGGTDGDFKELAQTWSKPQVTFIEKQGNSPVLIFAAGYDTNKDSNGKSLDSVGRGIFIVDAKTGSLVWSLTPKTGFKGKHSIPGDVEILDSNYDGYTDRLYFADTGGDVWRVDMPGANPNDADTKWTHFKLAELADVGATGDRRFFYKPAVANTYFSKVTRTTVSGTTFKTRKDTPYEAILLGSGNRSRPTLNGVRDYLFMIRDENTVTQSFQSNVPEPIKINNLMDISNDPFAAKLSDLEGFTDVEVTLGSFHGWKYALSANEKSLAAPTVVGGVAYFTSFTPPATVSRCEASAGKGGLYAFHLHYGTQVYDKLKYETTPVVPDTPKKYVSCENGNGTDCETVVRMVGPAIKKGEGSGQGKGPVVGTPWKAAGIVTEAQPVVINGKINLIREQVDFGLKTRQMFIYKKEENDEK
ncbi:pilin biogenesis protein [Pseudoalteromonas sp. JBTF-M23]|uniref:Pilin biogenesis protein n=1 Tax=Pseudoalteromonas caenipelagi TaxID=2726988 RepID=A0A849VCU1_9GAMM|nr:PilC/PilY family type IV pilus protein [Pseudoalteromonas caenipelagi]NOU50638.1 pilin biogenesis protein [Pseudoalteromonas caenipelagi]